jgi:hypothetical protein
MARGKHPSIDPSIDNVAGIVRDALGRGATVDIDGLGSFRKIGNQYCFEASDRPRVFIAYAHEDAEQAGNIFDALQDQGVDAWMDERKILPGQNWARALRNALETADFVVCCFSHNSIHKRGGFQAEMRYALEAARRLPLDEVFLLPVRLDECPVPSDVARDMQYLDLFPDWEAGMDRLLKSIWCQMRHPRAA